MDMLGAYIAVAPNLRKLFHEDMAVAIADTEKFVAYFPGEKIDLGIKIGQFVTKEEPMYQTLTRGLIANAVVPKEAFGIAF